MPTPRNGYFAADGAKLQSVTQYLGNRQIIGGLMWYAYKQGQLGLGLYEKRDQAADVGTFVHALTDANLRGLSLPAPPEGMSQELVDQAMSGFHAYQAWREQTRLEVISLEVPLVSEEHRFGGTPDAIATSSAGLALLDWKTSSGFYPDHLIQCVAYVKLYAENHPDADFAGGIHVVRFGKLGANFAHYHFPITHPALAIAWRQFLLLKEAFENDQFLKELVK